MSSGRVALFDFKPPLDRIPICQLLLLLQLRYLNCQCPEKIIKISNFK